MFDDAFTYSLDVSECLEDRTDIIQCVALKLGHEGPPSPERLVSLGGTGSHSRGCQKDIVIALRGRSGHTLTDWVSSMDANWV